LNDIRVSIFYFFSVYFGHSSLRANPLAQSPGQVKLDWEK